MVDIYEPGFRTEMEKCDACGKDYKPPMVKHNRNYCKLCYRKTLEDEHFKKICKWTGILMQDQTDSINATKE